MSKHPKHNTRPCSINGCIELNYSSSTQCYTHLRKSSDNKKSKDKFNKGEHFKMFDPYPTPKKYIYFIFNKFTKDIVYIGETTSGRRRMYIHFKNPITSTSKLFTKKLTSEERREYYDWIWVEDCWDLSKSEMRELEKKYIDKYKPILNGKKRY